MFLGQPNMTSLTGAKNYPSCHLYVIPLLYMLVSQMIKISIKKHCYSFKSH